jgi:hypothetical protein
MKGDVVKRLIGRITEWAEGMGWQSASQASIGGLAATV